MAFRSFRVNCTLRVVVLAATTLVFSLLLGGTQYLTLGFCGLLIRARGSGSACRARSCASTAGT